MWIILSHVYWRTRVISVAPTRVFLAKNHKSVVENIINMYKLNFNRTYRRWFISGRRKPNKFEYLSLYGIYI